MSKRRIPLPGQNPDTSLDVMLRVDHAGEHGAVRIYDGQLAVLGRSRRTRRTAAKIKTMAAQEQKHLETFDQLLPERGVRPTALMPVWSAAGFVLGGVTALMGEKAAMACTAAVEEVIEEHYGDQIETLNARGEEPEIAAIFEEFQAEEAGHRETALAEGAEAAPAYPLLSRVIKVGCRAAIRASEKI